VVFWSLGAWCSGRKSRMSVGPVELGFRYPYGPAVFLRQGSPGAVAARVAEEVLVMALSMAQPGGKPVAPVGDDVATCSRFGPALAG